MMVSNVQVPWSCQSFKNYNELKGFSKSYNLSSVFFRIMSGLSRKEKRQSLMSQKMQDMWRKKLWQNDKRIGFKRLLYESNCQERKTCGTETKRAPCKLQN